MREALCTVRPAYSSEATLLSVGVELIAWKKPNIAALILSKFPEAHLSHVAIIMKMLKKQHMFPHNFSWIQWTQQQKAHSIIGFFGFFLAGMMLCEKPIKSLREKKHETCHLVTVKAKDKFRLSICTHIHASFIISFLCPFQSSIWTFRADTLC